MPQRALPTAGLDALPLALAGTTVLLLWMALLWLRQKSTGNAAIVDVGWTIGLGALGVGYALLLEGDALRRGLIGAMVGLWSVRLAAHLVRDRLGGRPEEGRYQRLRAHWGRRAQPYLLLFFLAQAVLGGALSIAFLPAMQDARAALDLFDLTGLALWLIAWGGEAIADRQLARFKAEPDSTGRVCDRGLWAWSRHPNYFFEWLIWIAFVLPGLPSPWGWLSLLAPLAMLIFILKVTGVPTSEAQALRSRGDAYRAYRRRVSVFVPLPPSTRGVS